MALNIICQVFVPNIAQNYGAACVPGIVSCHFVGRTMVSLLVLISKPWEREI